LRIPAGKGLATVGVGPESAEGIIRAGRKERKELEVVLIGRGETGYRSAKRRVPDL